LNRKYKVYVSTHINNFNNLSFTLKQNKMKKISLLVVAVLISVATFAQTWKVDKAHSKVNFTVTHLLISEVDGSIKSYDATLTSSKEDFSDAVFELTADLKTVDTNQEMRNAHLQKADMFDTEKFPTLTFKSTSITSVGPKKFKLIGDLTMKGVTKSVSLDLAMLGTTKGRDGKAIVGFKASGMVNRTAFGVGAMPAAVVSEEVELRASGEFKAQ
jgi:polyisoprenoid-binding protein YceI